MSSFIRNHRLLFICIFIAIVARLLMWGWVTSFNMLPTGDEEGYYRRAESFARILSDISSGYTPYPDVMNSAYGSGRWPPLHPLIFGAAIQLTGAEVSTEILAIGRLVISIFSVATVVVFYSFARYLFNDIIAFIASLIYTFHPESIINGCRVMSETPFIFFFLISFYALIRIIDSISVRNGLIWTIVCGVGLGLCLLTRSTALPFFVIFPIWIWLATRNRKGILFGVMIILLSLIVTSPWTFWLYEKEQRLVPISTSGTLNLYLNNNDFFDINYDYEPNPSNARDDAYDYLRAYAKEENITVYSAGSKLGIEQIRNNPILFVRRVIDRAFHFWATDNTTVQLMIRLRFPPMSPAAVVIVMGVLQIIHTLTFFFIFRGLVLSWSSANHKWIILLSSIAMMGLSLVSVSAPRYHFIALLLLLPFAGYGIYHREILPPYKRIIVYGGTFLILIGSLFSVLPYLHSQKSSAYYHELLATVDNWLGVPTELGDQFQMITWAPEQTAPITLTIESDGYEFNKGKKSIEWIPADDRKLQFTTYAYAPVEDLQIRLDTTVDGEVVSVILNPFITQAWQSWSPTGIPAVDFQWDADA